jgi:hypothetical protein
MLLRAVSLLFVVMAALPAKADIILSYHLSSFAGPATAPIPDNLPLGPQITDLTMNVGDVRYVQIAVTGNANAPTIVQGQDQTNWNVGNGMIAFGFDFHYPVGLVSQPWVMPTLPLLAENLPNANAQLPYTVSTPILFGGYNMGTTRIGGLTLGAGLEANAGILPTTVIATLKVVATNSGTSTFTLTDPNPILSAGSFGLLDNTNLDPIVFASSHANFPLSMHIAAVPEPSSFALLGIAAAIGWRRLRR